MAGEGGEFTVAYLVLPYIWYVNTQVEDEPPPLLVLLLVPVDLEEKLRSLGGHEVGVALG